MVLGVHHTRGDAVVQIDHFANLVLIGFDPYPIPLLETLQDYKHIALDDDLMFCLDSWVKTETDILTEWYRLDTVPPLQEAVERLARVAPKMLYDALRMD